MDYEIVLNWNRPVYWDASSGLERTSKTALAPHDSLTETIVLYLQRAMPRLTWNKLHRKERIREHENHPFAHHLEHLHDLCVVRPLEVPLDRSLESDCDQLGHRVLRVLLPGTGESHWFVRIHRRATEDHSGGHHPDG